AATDVNSKVLEFLNMPLQGFRTSVQTFLVDEVRMHYPRLHHILRVCFLGLGFILHPLHLNRAGPDFITRLLDLTTKAFKGMTYRAAECVNRNRKIDLRSEGTGL